MNEKLAKALSGDPLSLILLEPTLKGHLVYLEVSDHPF